MASPALPPDVFSALTSLVIAYLFFAEHALFILTLLALAAFGWYTDEPRRRHVMALGTPVLAVALIADRAGPGVGTLILMYVLVLGASIPGLYLYGRARTEKRRSTVSVL